MRHGEETSEARMRRAGGGEWREENRGSGDRLEVMEKEDRSGGDWREEDERKMSDGMRRGWKMTWFYE